MSLSSEAVDLKAGAKILVSYETSDLEEYIDTNHVMLAYLERG